MGSTTDNGVAAVDTQTEPLLTSYGKLLTDRDIKAYAERYNMLEPFSDKLNSEGVISWGLSSMGYDIRVADEFKVFTNVWNSVVDPKAFDENSFVTVNAPEVVIPPNSFVLAKTVEYFRIPDNVLTVCLGKSTYARCGLIVNVTPFEPGWEGYAVLEISNTTPLPAKVYANEGVAQVLFFASEDRVETTYGERKGKYQNQQSIVLPKVMPKSGDSA